MSNHQTFIKVTRKGTLCDLCDKKNTSVTHKCATCGLCTCRDCHQSGRYDYGHNLSGRNLDWTVPEPVLSASRRGRGPGRARGPRGARRSAPGRVNGQDSRPAPQQTTAAAFMNSGGVATGSFARPIQVDEDMYVKEESLDDAVANFPLQRPTLPQAGRSGISLSNGSYVPPRLQNAMSSAASASSTSNRVPRGQDRRYSSGDTLGTLSTLDHFDSPPTQGLPPGDIQLFRTPGARAGAHSNVVGAGPAPEATTQAAHIASATSLNPASAEHFYLFSDLFYTWRTSPVLERARRDAGVEAAADMMEAAITLEMIGSPSAGSWGGAAQSWVAALRRVEGARHA